MVALKTILKVNFKDEFILVLLVRENFNQHLTASTILLVAQLLSYLICIILIFLETLRIFIENQFTNRVFRSSMNLVSKSIVVTGFKGGYFG